MSSFGHFASMKTFIDLTVVSYCKSLGKPVRIWLQNALRTVSLVFCTEKGSPLTGQACQVLGFVTQKLGTLPISPN